MGRWQLHFSCRTGVSCGIVHEQCPYILIPHHVLGENQHAPRHKDMPSTCGATPPNLPHSLQPYGFAYLDLEGFWPSFARWCGGSCPCMWLRATRFKIMTKGSSQCCFCIYNATYSKRCRVCFHAWTQSAFLINFLDHHEASFMCHTPWPPGYPGTPALAGHERAP